MKKQKIETGCKIIRPFPRVYQVELMDGKDKIGLNINFKEKKFDLTYSSLDENNEVKASGTMSMSLKGIPFELETRESYTLFEKIEELEEKEEKVQMKGLGGRTAKYISTLSSLIKPGDFIEEKDLDKAFPEKNERRGVKQSLYYLERKGIVKIESSTEGKRYRILDKSLFESYEQKEIEIKDLDFLGWKEKKYALKLFKLEKDGKISKEDIFHEFTKGERIVIGRINKKLIKHGFLKEEESEYEVIKNVKID